MSVGSFLEPSIVPYRYRPKGFALGASKKNLLHVFGSEDDIMSHHEKIKVYLRLKPSHSHHDRIDLMDVLDSHTLLVKASSSDDLSRRKTADCKYTFSKIFGSNTRQKELFTECVQPLVSDFLNGQNCLLFSFGTTNAGKTFTIQGTGEQPGIIPRVLKMTFKSVSERLGTSNTFCPYQVMSAIELTRNSLIEMDDLKNRILYWCQNDSGHAASNVRGSSEDLIGSQKFCEMQEILNTEVKGITYNIDDNDEVLIWVSFIEIYNERVFDLLDLSEKGKKRKELKLAQDAQKNNYVKGVRYIPVKSESEAYKVLLFGKHNLQIESTNLNSSSSRSHCIFTIKLLKYSKLNNPDFVSVSSFSICDLAGSERQKKTLNDADRLKESQSINSSLHVLNRCFSIIRENQIKNEKKLIPYRDSKLTQLFKRALSGNESITMIVNVSLSKILYEESQYALKASAIAHQIIVQPKPRFKQSAQRSSRFSQLVSKRNGGGTILWDSSVKSDTSGEPDGSCDSRFTLESSQIQKLQDEVETLLAVVDTLHEKLKTKKNLLREEKQKNHILEYNLRKQLTSEFGKILNDTESHYQKQLEFMMKSKEKTFESTFEVIRNHEPRVEIPNKRKRCDSEGSYTTCTEDTVVSDKMQALRDEIELLKETLKIQNEDAQEELTFTQQKITGLTELLETSKREKSELSLQINELKFQNGLLQHEIKKLQRTTEAVKSDNTQALLDQIEQLKEIIKDRDELLEEARHDIEHEIKEKEQAESEVMSIETQLAEKDDAIDKLNADLDSMKHLLSTQIEKNESLEEKLDKYNEMIDTMNELKSELESMKNTLFTKEERLEVLENKYEQYQTVINRVEQLENDLNDANSLLSIKSRRIDELEDKQKEFQHKEELNKKLQNEIDDLKKTLAERTDQLKSAEAKIEQQEEDLHLQLANSIKELDAKDVQILDLEREVKTLHTELKQEIQRNQEFKENPTASDEDLKKLKEKVAYREEELRNVKSLIRELQESISFKDVKLECMQNKLEAFEQTASILTAYKDEVEKKNTELEEAKELSKRQAATISNLEQEIVTFQNNQKTINSKYDEQLRKCKEDVEREKREAARLRETWIKLTPTPKSKEEYIKRLEQQLESLTKSEKKNRSPCNTCNRENKSARKPKVVKSLIPQGVCTRSMKAVSVDDGIVPLSENTVDIQNKSTQKKGRHNPLSLISSNYYENYSHYTSEQSLLESSKKTRRKLYSNSDQISTNDDTEQIEEIPIRFHQSPNSVIKCNLRKKFDNRPC